MCWKALLLVWQARRRSSVTSAAPTDSDQSGRPLRRAPRALHRTDRALERAQIRACAAWARHDCFCPRAGAGRAIAMATFRWPGSGSPQLGRARACLDRLCVCNGPIPHALASALLPATSRSPNGPARAIPFVLVAARGGECLATLARVRIRPGPRSRRRPTEDPDARSGSHPAGGAGSLKARRDVHGRR